MATRQIPRDDGGLAFVDDLTSSEFYRVGGTGYRNTKVAKVPLKTADTAGGIFAFQNPENVAILVDRVELDITTASTGACSVEVGSAANATTASANLIDTQSVATVGVLNNVDNKGTNGKSVQKVATGAYVTGSTASGASAGLVGNAYIHYVLV